MFKASFIIYGTGLGSLFLTDLLVSSNLPNSSISDWALIRSLIGIAAVIPLIGLDQVIVRRPTASAQLLKMLAIQAPLLACAVGVFLFVTNILDTWWMGALLAIGSACSLVQFQYFRSHNMRILSQLAQQGWKITALFTFGIMILADLRCDIITIILFLIILNNFMVSLAMWFFPPSSLCPQSTDNIKSHYSIGFRFMVTNSLLALSIYGEQVVVNRLGSDSESALYFASATYFLFPISFLNGYVAFIIGPWLRENHDRFVDLVKDYWILIFVGAFLMAATLNVLGWFVWLIVDPPFGKVNRGLQLLFFVTAFAKTLYALPSGYLGVYGQPRQHNHLICFQVVALLPVTLLFWYLCLLGFELIHSVAAASALNWCLRTLVGVWITNLVVRARDRGSEY